MAVYKLASQNTNNIAKGTTMSSLPNTYSYNNSITNNTAKNGTNNGGVLGGIGYALEKVGLGFVSGVEGLVDYTVGSLAELFGNDELSEEMFANDWVNYNHADEWYDPGDGWKVVGDIAGSIGTSLPSIAGAAAGAAVIYFSGGTLSAVGAKMIVGSISAGIAGLSAAGNATKEAYQESGELGGKEFGYGAILGTTEAGLEFISGGIMKGGGRIVGEMAEWATKKGLKETTETVAKSVAKNGAKSIFKELGEDFISEAIEEGISEAVSPVYKRLTYDPDAELATPKEIAYAAFVGGMSGLVMSGTRAGVNTSSEYVLGKKVIDNGKADSLMKLAEEVSQKESEYETGFTSFADTKDIYTELKTSLEKTGGEIKTANQKILLGKLAKTTTVSGIMPEIERSAERIASNPEALAAQYSEYLSSASGEKINLTAEQLTKGIDMSLQTTNRRAFLKQLRAAISTNPALSTLAIADATSHIFMDTNKFADAALNGKTVLTEKNFNNFLEKASDKKKAALAEKLGIEDLNAISIDGLNAAIAEFFNSEEGEEYRKRLKRFRSAEKAVGEKSKKLPTMFRSNMADGVYRYTENGENIALIKEGDSYTIFDYESRNLTEPASIQEVNKALREYRNKNNSAEMNGQSESNIEKSYAIPDDSRIIKDTSKNVIDLSQDDRLSALVKGKHGSERYNIIRDFILTELQGQPIRLSDGKQAIVDRSDAMHISHKAGDKKAAQISHIKQIVETAELYAEEESTKDKKFNSFWYYEAFVKYGKYTLPVYVNVGKAINDGTFHIYDITQNIRDTAHRINDVERPKPNEGYAQKNGISNKSIPQPDEKINTSDKKSYTVPEIMKLAKEKVKGYEGMNESKKLMVRGVIRRALANGFSESDAVRYARVAARSGVAIKFDKARCSMGLVDNDGNLIFADGFYDRASNEIVVNPEGTRSTSKLLIHELAHAIYKTRTGAVILEKGVKNLTEDQIKSIEKKYGAVYKGEAREYKLKDEKNAHYAEDILGDDKLLEKLLEDKPTIMDKILNFFKGAESDYADDERLSKEARKLYRHYKKLFDQFAERNQDNNLLPDHGEAYVRDVVFVDRDTFYYASNDKSAENDSIKKQLRDHLDEVNAMDPVVSVEFDANKITDNIIAKKVALEEYTKLGKQIDRQNFGIILIGKDELGDAMSYVHTDAERAALLAIPKVLKRGKIISGHENHKEHNFPSVTIAAPVVINGKRGNVAVVVQQKGKNKYHAHRILLPDGSVFVLEKNKAELSTASMSIDKDRQRLPNSSASIKIIPQFTEKSTQNDEKNFALPDNMDTDKVTISKNRFAQLRANNQGEKVFYKKDILTALSKVDAISKLTQKQRGIIADRLCQGYNQRVDEDGYEKYSIVMSVKLFDELHESSMTDEEVKSLKKQIKLALQNIVDSGKPSVKSKVRETVVAEEFEKELKKELSKHKKRIDEQYKRRAEGKETTVQRNLLRRDLARLNTRLLKPTKTRNVPYWMEDAIVDVMTSLKMDTARMVDLANVEDAIYKEQNQDAPNLEKLRKLEAKRDILETQTSKIRDQFKAMYEAYENLKSEHQPDSVRNEYQEEVAERLKNLKTIIGDTPIASMKHEQILAARAFVAILMQQVRNSQELLTESTNNRIWEVSETVMEEIRNAKVPALLHPKANEMVANAKLREYVWKFLKPYEAFEMLGSPTLTKYFEKLQRAEGDYGRFIDESRSFIQVCKKKYNFDSWDYEVRKELKLTNGQSVKLSLGELMSLYAYGRRENARSHLNGLGFMFAPSATFKGKNESKKNFSMRLERLVNDSNRYELSEVDFGTISGMLTEEQREFAKAMQAYLSNDVAEKGNEVSKKLYGIELFKEEFYWPMVCAKEWLNSEVSKIGDPKIKNKGITNSIRPDAKNPLVLMDFMEVFDNHINDMALYSSFVLPMEDINRILNYRPTGGFESVVDGGEAKTTMQQSEDASSLKAIMRSQYGDYPIKYIEQLLRDLNGGAVNSKPMDIIDKGIRNFKVGATAASLSTASQQNSSIARAWSIIDPKYFSVPKLDRSGAKMEELKKYAPIAIIKEMGGFDTGVGRSLSEYLNEKDYKGIERIKALKNDPAYRSKVFGYLSAKADEVTWLQIWEACKREQKDKNPDLAMDSDELLKKAGERFTEVIQKTQVYDSTLSRNEMMRSKDTGWKMATAFMAEPTTIMNMLIMGYVRKTRGEKGFGRIVSSVLTAAFINAAISSLIYAARDDDEDETYVEKYLTSLVGKSKDQLNPLTMLPFVRDIWSIIQGYDIERTDMAVISDFVNSVRKLFSSDSITVDQAMNFVTNTCQLFGIPARNIYRDVKGICLTGLNFANGEKTTSQGVKNALWEGLVNKEFTNAQQLYDAATSNDTMHYNRVFARYKNEDSANTALRTALRDNDKRIEVAANAKLSGDMDTYNKIISQIVSEGYFNRAFVIRAVASEYSAIKRELEEYGVAVFADGKMYTLSEEQKTALAVTRTKLETELSNLSKMTRYVKLSEEQKEIALTYAEDLIDDIAETFVLGVYNGNNALLANIVGINNVAVFYACTKSLESDKDKYGKTISGTKKKKILAAIKSLGLSTEEQMLLLCAKGYSINDSDVGNLSAVQAKKRLLRYILNLKNVSKENKAELAKMCGFEVKNGKIIQKSVV